MRSACRSRPLYDETALIERARDGDLDAYQVLVREHQHAAVRLAAAVSGGWGDPEGVAQEAFVKAYGALRRFRSDAAFKPWLLAIVVNEARNARRSAQRQHRLAERLAAQPEADGASPEMVVLDFAERRLVLAAVERLPRRQREALACRYLLELSEAETAAVLRIPRGTVKSRVSRALRMLRADLTATHASRRSREVT